MEEIRAILLKVRAKRHTVRKAKAHVTEDVEDSSENSALSNENEEAFAIDSRLSDRKSPLPEWIADTGASAHMTDQLYLFRGPLTKVKRRSVRVGDDTRLSIKGIGNVQV
jgi:hypothetical protein